MPVSVLLSSSIAAANFTHLPNIFMQPKIGVIVLQNERTDIAAAKTR